MQKKVMRHFSKVIVVLGLPIFLLLYLSLNQKVSAQSAPNEGDVGDVLGAFNRIDNHGVKFASHRGAGGILPNNNYDASPPDEHLQGIQRIRDNYIAITGANREHGSQLIIVRLDSKSSNGNSFLRSNLLNQNNELEQVPVEPNINDTVVAVVNLDSNYFHAGGMGIHDNILSIPLESSEGVSKIVFYDVTNPENPVPVTGSNGPIVLDRNFSHSFYFDQFNQGMYTNKAGVTFLTKLPDGRFLLGVWTDSDSLIRTFERDRVGSFPVKRLTLYISQSQNTLDFDPNDYTNLCSSVASDGNTDVNYDLYTTAVSFIPGKHSHLCDDNRSLNFPEPSFQNLSIVTEDDSGDADGDRQMYLVSTYNTDIELFGIGSIEITQNGIGVGEDRATLWSLDFPLDGNQRNYDSVPSVNHITERHFRCDNGIAPYIPGLGTYDESYCNFQAAASIFVNNERDLSMYSVDYYYVQDNNLITFEEFRSLPESGDSINDVSQSWVELYKETNFSPTSGSWMIDFLDHGKADYSDLYKVDDVGGTIRSARYQIHQDYQYLLFSQPDQKGTMEILEGTGHLEEKNLQNDDVWSSGSAANQDNTPVSGSQAFIKENISDPSEGWIELYETESFTGIRLRINGNSFNETAIADYRNIVENANVSLDSQVNNNFNDKVLSMRYQLPEGSVYRLYRNINFKNEYFDLVGSGLVEELQNFGSTTLSGEISSSRFFNNPPEAVATITPLQANRHDTITLDGSQSSDAENDPLTYTWTQTSGTAVEIENVNEAITTFHAPTLTASERLRFKLTVQDDKGNSDSANVVVFVIKNRAPKFTNKKQAPKKILENSPYSFDFDATDLDGDNLTFESTSNTTAPDVSMNSESGVLTWTSPDVEELTNYIVEVKVSDDQGASDTYQWEIAVRPNSPPIIKNKGNEKTTIKENRLYQFNVNATDADKDVLTYTLLIAPEGMTINAEDGLINWTTPDVPATRIFSVKVEVTDGRGGSDSHEWDISVTPIGAGPNIPPRILNKQEAPTSIFENEAYNFQVFGEDDNIDQITFQLTQSPEGMIIDSFTGEISWTAPEFVEGNSNTYFVEVVVSDGRGGSDFDQWFINVEEEVVIPEQPPVISSSPTLSAVMKKPYEYSISASDPDGGSVYYTLMNAPSGMTLSANIIRWIPSVDQAHETCGVKNYNVSLKVSDDEGQFIMQDFQIGVRCIYGLIRVDTNPVQISGPKNIPRMFDGLWQWPNAYVIHYVANTPITFTLEFENPVALTGFKTHSATHWVVKSANSWGGSRTTLISDGQVVSQVADFATLSFPETSAKVFDITFIRREGDGVVHAAEIEPIFSSNFASVVIDEVPNQTLSVGFPWAENVGATYTSSIPDVLFCSKITGPSGMLVSSGLTLSDTCRLSWTPAAGSEGEHTVTLRVVDSRGNEDTETFVITVNE